jgi:MerR family transcriptional regulator, repressor of the yfmOP operon
VIGHQHIDRVLNDPPEDPPSGDASDSDAESAGLRIGDAAARFGVSARTLRYYEELGLLAPSGYTSGGERRYHSSDLAQLERILELRDVLGMNLDEIRTFLQTENRLDELRTQYRERKAQPTAKARRQQREILEELLSLTESLTEQLDSKLERMTQFREELASKAQRCRSLLADLA